MSTAQRRLLIVVVLLLTGGIIIYIQRLKVSLKHNQLQPAVVVAKHLQIETLNYGRKEILSSEPEPDKPADDSTAYHIEALTLKRGIAQRRPYEPDTSFLRRVLPISYSSAYNNLVITYAWRPTPFGKQLFFSRTNGGDNEYDLFLFILDPYKAGTYAVQAFDMGNMGDLTTVAAIFFADVDQDGRKELLALNECDLRETFKDINGELELLKDGEEYDGEKFIGRVPHYETHVFQYAGVNKQGYPRYREDNTPRAYLDKLPTATAVRQAIRQHQQKAAKRKLSKKP